MSYNQLPSKEVINSTIEALKNNGIEAVLVESKDQAKIEALKHLPEGVEVMNMTSVTLTEIGVEEEIVKSGKYQAVRNSFHTLDEKTEHSQRQKLGAAPTYALGSVHAITEDGHIFTASQTGSQLPAYAYGADHLILVVGTQKIVKDFNQAFDRIYTYVLPLESERARKAYGTAGSAVNKLLIINKEIKPDRIKIIFINEVIGF